MDPESHGKRNGFVKKVVDILVCTVQYSLRVNMHRKHLLNSILKGTVSGEVRWVLLMDKSIESSFQWLMLAIIKF